MLSSWRYIDFLLAVSLNPLIVLFQHLDFFPQSHIFPLHFPDPGPESPHFPVNLLYFADKCLILIRFFLVGLCHYLGYESRYERRGCGLLNRWSGEPSCRRVYAFRRFFLMPRNILYFLLQLLYFVLFDIQFPLQFVLLALDFLEIVNDDLHLSLGHLAFLLPELDHSFQLLDLLLLLGRIHLQVIDLVAEGSLLQAVLVQ